MKEYDWTSDRDNCLIPRYAPKQVMTLRGVQTVARWVFHPIGQHPANCLIRKDMGVLEMITTTGISRRYGCKSAYINSELRMVVCGINTHDEVVRKWPMVPPSRRK